MKAKKPADYDNDGGPLFPIVTCDRNLDPQVTGGASLLDFLAAHAPEPPAWFELEITEPAPQQISIDEAVRQQPGFEQLSEEQQRELRSWVYDGSWGLAEGPMTAIGEAAQKLRNDSIDALNDWRARAEVETYFAWRWYYAQMMLRHRPATRG